MPPRLRSLSMQPIYDWFREFYERTGINLTFIYDDFDRARMVKGFFLTIELSVITILLSILIGIAGAWLQGSKLVWVRRIIAGFISAFRNTPPLVQIYFFYFGLGYLLPRVPDGSGALIPMISNFQWAVISLSLFAGAFNIEIFRSGIEAIPKATVEGATSLGLTPLADLSARRPADRHPRLPARARQQPRQPPQDHQPRLRHRRARAALRLQADLE